MHRLIIRIGLPLGYTLGPTPTDRPAKTNLQVIEVKLKTLYKNMTNVLYADLRDKECQARPEHTVELTEPFKSPDLMRKALSNPATAAVFLGKQYKEIADMVNHSDPFVIVIRDGKSVWGVVAPLEGN